MERNYNLKYRRGDDFVALSHREIENAKQAHIERPSVRVTEFSFVWKTKLLLLMDIKVDEYICISCLSKVYCRSPPFPRGPSDI